MVESIIVFHFCKKIYTYSSICRRRCSKIPTDKTYTNFHMSNQLSKQKLETRDLFKYWCIKSQVNRYRRNITVDWFLTTIFNSLIQPKSCNINYQPTQTTKHIQMHDKNTQMEKTFLWFLLMCVSSSTVKYSMSNDSRQENPKQQQQQYIFFSVYMHQTVVNTMLL